jgi:hypothetical protein
MGAFYLRRADVSTGARNEIAGNSAWFSAEVIGDSGGDGNSQAVLEGVIL